jgi:hypothetical protein
MTDSWPLRSSLELGALSSAVPCACLHVKHVLWDWGLNSLAESAAIITSELVTNAVDATGQPGQTVSVNLAGTGTGTGTRVLIEVRDADPQPPGPMSTRWDWYPTQDPPGKVVWCELATDLPAQASLPRRVPRARPKPQAEIVTDLDILRRLRDHLRS